MTDLLLVCICSAAGDTMSDGDTALSIQNKTEAALQASQNGSLTLSGFFEIIGNLRDIYLNYFKHVLQFTFTIYLKPQI